MCSSENTITKTKMLMQNREQIVAADGDRHVLRVEPAFPDERLRHLMHQHIAAARAGNRGVAEQRVRNGIEAFGAVEAERNVFQIRVGRV